MNRIRFYTVLALGVFLAAAVVFWHHRQHIANVASNTKASESVMTNSESVASLSNPTSSRAEPTASSQAVPNPMGITPGMTESQKQKKWVEWYVSEAHKLVPEQKVFEFYGKVVDENTQAVAGASVHLILSTTSSANGVMDVDTSSAEDGSFSLTGKTGSSVSVYVGKTGYYEIKSLNRIDFDPTGNGSSSDNPVLFHLRKKGPGVDLITSQLGMEKYFAVSIPRDGTQTRVNLLARTVDQSGQLIVSQLKPAYANWKQATEWSFGMEIPDGGFVEENDEFPFEAPEAGYQPIVRFELHSGETDFTRTLEGDYYIKFGNPPRYGQLHFETSVDTGGAVLTYSINPEGSRYLEPKN